MAPRRQLYRSWRGCCGVVVVVVGAVVAVAVAAAVAVAVAVVLVWGKVRLRNFHQQHETLLAEHFAFFMDCMSPGCQVATATAS